LINGAKLSLELTIFLYGSRKSELPVIGAASYEEEDMFRCIEEPLKGFSHM
jgi:hypothetical protein